MLRRLAVPKNGRYSRRGGDHVTVLEWVGKFLSGDKTRRVGNICHKVGPMFIGNLAKCGIIPITGICRGAANYETGFEDTCLRGEGSIINELGHGVKTVRE